MADLSGYTAVHVSTGGNDSTGNGSSGQPYATVQRAFRHAWLAGNTPTLATPQVTTFEAVDPLGNTVSIDINFWDSVGSSYQLQTYTTSASSAADAAYELANNINASSFATASASGSTVTVTTYLYGLNPDSTYGGNWIDISGSAIASGPTYTVGANYIPASQGSGNYKLVLGSGTFAGVNVRAFWLDTDPGTSITHRYSTNWPSRIAVQGAGSSSSNFGGVTGNGGNAEFDTNTSPYTVTQNPENGFSVNIVSDHTVNLGSVSTNGGSWNNSGQSPSGAAATAATITLTDCVCGSLSASGGNSESSDSGVAGGNGNEITLTNCTVNGNINAIGGLTNSSTTGETAGSGNAVTATDCVITGYVQTYGGTCGHAGAGGNGGSVSLTRTTVGSWILTNGGSGGTNDGGGSGGGGNVTLVGCKVAAAISTFGGGAVDSSLSGGVGNGGNLSITDTEAKVVVNLSAGSSDNGSSSYRYGSNGTVTMAGACLIPTTITFIGTSVTATNLKQGRGVNGSSILGIV